MNKIRKTFFGLSTISVTAMPLATTIACGASEEDNKKIVTIAVEKSLKAAIQKIINDFKTNHKEDLETNGIKDIKIIEQGAFDASNFLKTKGFRDETIPDIFLLPSDNLSSNQNFIKKFSTKNFDAFVTKYLKYISTNNQKPSLVTQGRRVQNLVDGKGNNNMVGVVQNVEALFQASRRNVNNPKMITKFADLWFSVGYFNDDPSTNNAWNMRNIIQTENNGKISTSANEIANKAKLKAGFKRIIEAARAGGITDSIALSIKSDRAAPKVVTRFSQASNVSIVIGPWDLEAGKIKGANNIPIQILPLPSTYIQFGGGWFYTLNKRITSQEQTVAEKLLASLINPKNSIDLWKVGKLLPFDQSKTIIASDNNLDSTYKQTAVAIYEAKVAPKPSDPAFNDVWGIYANVVSTNAAAIINNSRSAESPQNLANKLTTDFVNGIKAKVAERNSN